MKKKVLAVLLVAAMILSLAACGKKDDKTATNDTNQTTTTDTGSKNTETKTETTTVADPSNGELVNGKFTTTRKITVEVYDRDSKTPANDNVWTDWIKAQMLERYNVEVTFVSVPRWTEGDQINNLLAAQTAPDICYSYNYGNVVTYADMGGIIDLAPLLEQYKSLLPDLYNWLKDENIYYNLDPVEGTIWAIEGRRNNTYRINTFIRQDWLDTLGLKTPTTRSELETVLKAFKDNAKTLLGKDADQMIPLLVTSDVGWTAAPLIESMMDPDITDKELYVNGYDDRKYTQNGTKEAIRVLNKWYNEGLMWKDFSLYASGDSTADDLCKAGYVGVFMHNYDYPFRNGTDGINGSLAAKYGDQAKFVAVSVFEDKNGNYTHYSYSGAGDRKAFFPATNKEPLASLLYLNFISSSEAVEYLQKGIEGINHEVMADGAIKISAVSEENVKYNQNSGTNIDLTMTCNGLRLSSDELTNKSLALSYAPLPAADVVKAIEVAKKDAVEPKNVQCGTIEAEKEAGDLATKRDQGFNKAITASVADFDKVWDQYMKEYLTAGGQAIMDERKAAWEKTYKGDMIK